MLSTAMRCSGNRSSGGNRSGGDAGGGGTPGSHTCVAMRGVGDGRQAQIISGL